MFSIRSSNFFASPKSPVPDFSEFTLELSQISEVEQTVFSPLNSSINESKIEYFKNSPSVNTFKVRESFIAGLLSQELTLQRALSESSLKVKQLEIDLNFYVEQFRIVNDENLALQSLLIEKDKIIDELVADSTKINQKLEERKYLSKGSSDDDWSNEYSRKSPKNLQESSEKLQKTQETCVNTTCSHHSTDSINNKEIFRLLKENENLKIEICELENQMKKQDFYIIKELKSELKVNDSEGLIRRVLYLQEHFHQTKEILPVYSQISSIVSKAVGRMVTEHSGIIQLVKSKFLPQV